MQMIHAVPRLFLVPKKTTDQGIFKPSRETPGSVRRLQADKRSPRRAVAPENGPPAAA